MCNVSRHHFAVYCALLVTQNEVPGPGKASPVSYIQYWAGTKITPAPQASDGPVLLPGARAANPEANRLKTNNLGDIGIAIFLLRSLDVVRGRVGHEVGALKKRPWGVTVGTVRPTFPSSRGRAGKPWGGAVIFGRAENVYRDRRACISYVHSYTRTPAWAPLTLSLPFECCLVWGMSGLRFDQKCYFFSPYFQFLLQYLLFFFFTVCVFLQSHWFLKKKKRKYSC